MIASFKINNASVQVFPTLQKASIAAAEEAADIIRAAIKQNGKARVVIGTGNSQAALVDRLTEIAEIDWKSVEVFHMDEYVGISNQHPASFRKWLLDHVEQVVHPGAVHYLNGDAASIDEEIARYAHLLQQAPIDLCFPGFGENGHIAFNDPHVADLHDPLVVKRVDMDIRCRMQQVGEGHFPDLDSVPVEALTLTCPTLLSARHLICCVPEKRKAEAVYKALEGPISPACPGSFIRTHTSVSVYLDNDSSSELSMNLMTPCY